MVTISLAIAACRPYVDMILTFMPEYAEFGNGLAEQVKMSKRH
jgi:hypothetical protein